MHRLNVFAWICAIFCSASSNSIPFNDCGSLYQLVEVYINSCVNLPCVFPVSSVQTVTFVLYAEFESKELIQEVYFYYNGILYGLMVTPIAPCGDVLDCPLRSGGDASFKANVTINDTLPLSEMSGQLNWRGYNENGDLILCMQTSVMLRK